MAKTPIECNAEANVSADSNGSSLGGRRTSVNLWAAVIIGVGICGWIVRDAVWKTKITARLESIEKIVDRGVGDRWTATQMNLWSTKLQAENSELSVPDSTKIPAPNFTNTRR